MIPSYAGYEWDGQLVDGSVYLDRSLFWPGHLVASVPYETFVRAGSREVRNQLAGGAVGGGAAAGVHGAGGIREVAAA
ncbi:hypothetical protein BBK82_26885 [Lentzea guizhouensis]|uniref:Uncharacterized protein n=1 Tax=Lentzea guizhouensis TaxID=1586287 RepID=A0A1B2HN63_9PSEU|nr:hypothetical protein [Lentzea guizhouensis]ANZ39159.1 hypothetical protein BBK82_26885 [Lentzea guizhouensis]